MAERRLLVLGAGPAQLGLLAAARRRGLRVVAADRDPSAPGFRYAHRRALVPLDDEPTLERLARAERVDGIVAPGSDRTAATARIATRLGLPSPLRPEVAQRVAARRRERTALAGARLPLPRAVACRSPAEAAGAAAGLGFPCSLVALDRAAGAAVVARSARELGAAYAAATATSRASACLVEELPPGTPVIVVGIASPAGFRTLLVADDDAAGPAWPASLEPAAAGATIALADRAVAALGIDEGPVEVRVAPRGGDPCVLSVTPRLGRMHEPELCRTAVGVDLHELALRGALGEELPDRAETLPRRRVGAACIRLLPPAAPGERIAGAEQAFAVSGIAGIRTYCGRDRGGAILATGSDRATAVAAAERAATLLCVERPDAQAAA